MKGDEAPQHLRTPTEQARAGPRGLRAQAVPPVVRSGGSSSEVLLTPWRSPAGARCGNRIVPPAVLAPGRHTVDADGARPRPDPTSGGPDGSLQAFVTAGRRGRRASRPRGAD